MLSPEMQSLKSLHLFALVIGLTLAALHARGAAIGCGQTVGGNLSSAGQTNSYTFNANAGEIVTVLMLGPTFSPVAEVYNPASVRIGIATNNFTGPINLTNTGSYTIRVRASDSKATGAYGLSLSFLTGRCGTPLIWGLPVTNSMTALAEVDSYTFAGNAGESVTLQVNGANTNLTPAAYLASPGGVILANWVNGVSSATLITNGTYTLGVYSFYAGGAGSYSASLVFTKLVPGSYRLGLGMSNGVAVVTIWGQVGRATTLRSREDFGAESQWLTLTNFNLPWSPYRFVDSSSAGAAQRFYQTAQ